jgi:hypothetical protein
MSNFDIPNYYNRVRGNRDPKVTMSTYGWSDNNGTYGPFDFMSESSVDYIADIDKPYGSGVWPYSPMQRGVIKMQRYPRSLRSSRVASCCHGGTGPGYWWNGTYISPLIDVPEIDWDTGSVDEDSLFFEIPPHWWQRLSGRFEGRLPSLKGDSPGYFVSVVEFADILRTFNFLKAKSFLSKVSEGFLSHSFGVKPVIRDMQGLVPAIADHKEHVVDLAEQANIVRSLKASFYEPIDDTYTVERGCPYGCSGDPPGCGFPAYLAVRKTTRAYVNVCAKYRYHLPEYMYECVADLISTLGHYGMIPTAENLWDLIPFSFVLEWVVNVEKIFNRYKNFVNPHDPQIEIIDLCVSEGFETKYLYTSSLHMFDPIYAIDAEVNIKHFCRTVGSHALYTRIPWVKWPSFMQVALGAALGKVVFF